MAHWGPCGTALKGAVASDDSSYINGTDFLVDPIDYRTQIYEATANYSAEKLQLTGDHHAVPRKLYIRATDFPSVAFDRACERAKSDPRWIVKELSCGHDAMLDMPDALAEIFDAT